MLFERTKHWKKIYASIRTSELLRGHFYWKVSSLAYCIRTSSLGNHRNIFNFWLASLLKERSLINVKIDSIHMRTTQQNTRPVYNQINRKLIKLMQRRYIISITTLLEQIS
ncbi:hypothetical protein HZS_4933 [Henneguya salminicola]|nr:hypothetical protein HZS_4933 [Henneguya salminicola]